MESPKLTIEYFVIILLILIILWLYFCYKRPIDDSAENYKETIRKLSLDECKPVIRNKFKTVCDQWLIETRKNGKIIDVSELDTINSKLKNKIIDEASNSDFVFEKLAEEPSE